MADLANLLLADTERSSSISDDEYEKRARTYLRDLRKVAPQKLVQANSLLSQLDPSRNTIGYLFLLRAPFLSSAAQRLSDQTLFNIADFFARYDAIQARYAGAELRQLIEAVYGFINQTQDVGIETLHTHSHPAKHSTDSAPCAHEERHPET